MRTEVRSYIADKFRDSNIIVTVEEVLAKFPDLNRRDVVSYFQRKAEQNPRILFKSGRKGYPTRLEQGIVRMAVALVELVPDHPEDGSVIRKNEVITVIGMAEENGLFIVQCGTILTWAGPDEISFFKR